MLSPLLSVSDLARTLGTDVRLVRRAIARGDLPGPTSVCPVSGRDRWDRAALADYFRTLSDERAALADLVGTLQGISNDKTESVEGRQLAIDILSAIVNGTLDPAQELAELTEVGR